MQSQVVHSRNIGTCRFVGKGTSRMNEEIKRPEATEPRWPRWDYKTVWTNLSDTPTQAKMVIAGSEDEESFSRGRRLDADFLREKVAIRPGRNARIRSGSDRECIGRRGLLHRRFCLIDEWDRYRYVEEAVRVLRPGGRLCV